MSEKLTAKQAAEQLLYKPEYAADKSADVKEKAAAFAEGYKAFLNAAKTEREAAAASEKLLLEAGYEKFEPKKTYAPGQKIYFVQEHKAVVAATIGRKSFEEGFRLVIAHIDSPRLDLRPNPLYESDHLSYFKTHYYGGIRKYQWVAIPLELRGVVVSLLVGVFLGICSSFLGIGGGPINVALIIYLFSFDTKTATVCSLVTILFAQISKLTTVALTTGFGVFDLSIAPVMIVGAIAGGFIGASLNKKCSEAAVEKAFNAVQLLVLAISIFNIVRNLAA